MRNQERKTAQSQQIKLFGFHNELIKNPSDPRSDQIRNQDPLFTMYGPIELIEPVESIEPIEKD